MKVFDWKVDQREKRKNSVTIWYDESPFRENEPSESAKKGKETYLRRLWGVVFLGPFKNNNINKDMNK